MKKLATDIGVISFIYTAAYCFQLYVLVPFNSHDRASVFFFPAAVRILCTMIYGYRSCVGIMAGALIFYHLFDNTGLETELEYFLVAGHSGLACGVSLVIWALVSPKVSGVRNPIVAFKTINAYDVFQFCLINALVDTAISHTLFILVPDIMPDESPYWVLVTFVGNLTGAYLVFILLNLCYSLSKRILFFVSDIRSGT